MAFFFVDASIRAGASDRPVFAVPVHAKFSLRVICCLSLLDVPIPLLWNAVRSLHAGDGVHRVPAVPSLRVDQQRSERFLYQCPTLCGRHCVWEFASLAFDMVHENVHMKLR